MKCRRDELNNLIIGSFGPLAGPVVYLMTS